MNTLGMKYAIVSGDGDAIDAAFPKLMTAVEVLSLCGGKRQIKRIREEVWGDGRITYSLGCTILGGKTVNRDFYKELAAEMFHLPPEEIELEQRKAAKRAIWSLMYRS